MIKWKFVIIRLSILVVLFCLIHFGTAPLVSFVLRSTVQMVTGSKLEIENLDASPFQTRMSAGHVRLGHPKKPLENLFDFEQAEIKLDQASLLRKKFIVTTGSVDGLRFGSGRTESGQIEKDSSPQKPSLINNLLTSAGRKVADGLTSLLTRRFEENFETLRVSQEVLDRWPQEYDALLARGKKLESEIREIRDLATRFSDNPLNTLRDLPKVEQGVRDSVRIRNELTAIHQKLGAYRNQIQLDRLNILGAKERDLARIQEIKNDKRLNGRSLSQLLVGDIQGKRVDQAISWVKWLRETFPHPKNSIKASRLRGQTIRFAGQIDQPDFLIQTLRVNGMGTFDQKPYTFTGTVAGVTTQPEIYGKPALLKLEADGDIQFSVSGMIDRSQPVDHDRIELNIPELRLAAQKLKIDDAIQLKLGKANLKIVARVDLIGEELSGQIKATQGGVDVAIDSELDGSFAQNLKSMLNEDLSVINSYEIVANLSGTLSDPKWELDSNLGPQIASAMHNTLERGYEQKKNELIAKLDQETERALGKVAALVKEHEADVLQFISEKSKDIFQLEERVTGLLRKTGLRFR